MQIILANPRGFCAGVDRAIEIVERALELFGAPVYVRHEVVHNKYVVDTLRAKGAVFVEELDEVPDDTTVIFSAHGVAKQVREEAARRQLRVFDAICPLVTKVHMEVGHYQDEGRECILIGHEGHPEVEGTLGQYQPKDSEGGMYLVESVEDVWNLKVKNPDFLAFVTQTTLSMDDTAEVIDALRDRFPSIAGPKKEDICYATQNRQDAVKKLTGQCDIILVVGSTNSSNSTRLMEISQKAGVPAHLIDNSSQIKKEWFTENMTIGLTAGASAPEVLVEDVVKQLKEWGAEVVNEAPGKREKVVFSLPRELIKSQQGVTENLTQP
ncbi:MAG: 4-hydroxy-3-methylbut-2-enyl diphosphate reductase [Gammaproteobacteria bacterium]|nr:4-hydroxy-3-methylbut-2-enyl diphosphate reductase [Gammaproteobacteria bacterium]NIN62254.1 4-hydroxy-3-methylbut-2-enyl diphosphate reductase [Gammaproteobacteria bacterium]NIO62265.1 4-hydroxy-3-methylbut-2-enyl diphosphate reductase [Gammaproteobacteria bacterium]NIP48784.1 4-hydroxy-3-methylbut-2-enyl diphosphate reductase [Gammaproteobacteria bacterium]NIQ09238.1 4-hydroxy-3-methylbut-2-enyl diphosphate reductase [Gammaproteobacteria bacterium]